MSFVSFRISRLECWWALGSRGVGYGRSAFQRDTGTWLVEVVRDRLQGTIRVWLRIIAADKRSGMASSRRGWEGVVLGAEVGRGSGPPDGGEYYYDGPPTESTLSEVVGICRCKDQD